MNQLTMGLLVALGLLTFFLYTQNETLKENNLKLDRIDGMSFNILKDEWSLSSDKSVNYITKFIKN